MTRPSDVPRRPSPDPALASFYEAAVDEVECGWFAGCKRDATTRIEWADGRQSVACDEHTAAGRRDFPRLITRLSDWIPS